MQGSYNITQDTTVTFPGGSCQENAQVIAAHVLSEAESKLAIFTNITPFHPVDHLWPDHPADRGELVVGDRFFSVKDCLTAAYEPSSGTLLVDKQIMEKGIKRNQQGWTWLVAHVINAPKELEEGLLNQSVELKVEKDYREALSQAHSLCHFAALALNQVLTEFDDEIWRKDNRRKDTLGNNEFDKLALTNSEIKEWECVDEYRVGKTLRKKAGINITTILNNLVRIQEQVQSTLSRWVEEEPRGEVVPHEARLSEDRQWKSNLGGRELQIPCGATHASFFGPGKIETKLKAVSDDSFAMYNRLTKGGGDD